jgi:hypothetical protein
MRFERVEVSGAASESLEVQVNASTSGLVRIPVARSPELSVGPETDIGPRNLKAKSSASSRTYGRHMAGEKRQTIPEDEQKLGRRVSGIS